MKYHANVLGPGVALSLGLGLWACAGTDTPKLDTDERRLLAVYASEGAAPVAAAPSGGGGMGGGAATRSVEAGLGGTGGSAAAATAGTGGMLTTGAGGSGGASADTGAGGSASTVPSARRCDGIAVLQANCGTSGCHGAGSNLGNFAESEAVARTFVGKEAALTCKGFGTLIVPEDPEESILVQKLIDSPPCGNNMPLAGALLEEEDVECIIDWMRGL